MSQEWPTYPQGPDFRAPDTAPPATPSPPAPPPYQPAYQQPAYPPRPPRKSTGPVIALVVAVLALVLIGGFAVFGVLRARDVAEPADPTHSPTAPTQPSAPTKPTGPIEPAPPAPPASGSLKERLDEQYGTFDTITRTGTGAAVIELPEDARRGIVWAKTDGNGWFSIKAVNADGMNTPLFYSGQAEEGTVGYGLRSRDRLPDRFVIESTEATWSIEVRPMSSAPVLTDAASGTGMSLLVHDGAARPVRLDYRGDANFIVVQHSARRSTHHANEIGSATVDTTLDAGLTVIEVEAWLGGEWAIRAR